MRDGRCRALPSAAERVWQLLTAMRAHAGTADHSGCRSRASDRLRRAPIRSASNSDKNVHPTQSSLRGRAMRRCPASFPFVVASACIALVAAGRHAHAQAWVDDKGTLQFNLGYNLGISDKVVVDKGSDFPDAGSTTHELTLAAEYVPVQHLAVDVALPLVMIEFTGQKNAASAHPGGGRYDDGSLHTTLTDLRAGARYQLLDDPLALAPHVAVSIPVANYETVGNAVAGRHLKALHLGLSAGRVFLESAYVHAIYEFSLVEKYDRTMETAQFGQNRSDFTATVGYRLLDQRLDLHLDVNGR